MGEENMDYKVLVKFLREHAKHDGDCDICPYYDAEERGYGVCSEELAAKAADAIEELIAALTASNEVIAKSKPKWIPVTERMPDMKDYDYVLGIVNGSDINVRFENAVEMVSYDPRSGWFMDSFPDAEISVSYWMLLPEPPEGDDA
jgi:hypothetical protein